MVSPLTVSIFLLCPQWMVTSLTVWVYFYVGNSTGVSSILQTRKGLWNGPKAHVLVVKRVSMWWCLFDFSGELLHEGNREAPPQLCYIWILHGGAQATILFNSFLVSIRTTHSEEKKIRSLTQALVMLQFDPSGDEFPFQAHYTQSGLKRGLFAPCSDDLHLHFFGRTVKIFGHFALAWLFLDAKSS